MFGRFGFRSLRNVHKLIVTLLLVSLISLVVYVAAYAYLNYVKIGSKGVIKTIQVGVYSDSACTTDVSSIDWGMLEPGSSMNTTFYVRNEGNVPANLSLSTTDWQPDTGPTFLSLTWNYDGRTMQPQEIFTAILTLTVSPSVDFSNFTVDIMILASG